MDALARSEPPGDAPESARISREYPIRKIDSRLLLKRLIAHGIPREKAQVALRSDPEYRERVYEVIREELREAHRLGPVSCALVREPGLFYAQDIETHPRSRISPTTTYLLTGHVYYVVEAGIVVSVRKLVPESARRVRGLEGLSDVRPEPDHRLDVETQVPLFAPQWYRIDPVLPNWLREPAFAPRMFILPEGQRCEAMIREAADWCRRMNRPRMGRTFFDPRIRMSVGERTPTVFERLSYLTPPPDVDWEKEYGRNVPEHVMKWWKALCFRTALDMSQGPVALMLLPSYARTILEIVRGSGGEQWRSMPNLLRPGTMINISLFRGDGKWIGWEIFRGIPLRRCVK